MKKGCWFCSLFFKNNGRGDCDCWVKAALSRVFHSSWIYAVLALLPHVSQLEYIVLSCTLDPTPASQATTCHVRGFLSTQTWTDWLVLIHPDRVNFKYAGFSRKWKGFRVNALSQGTSAYCGPGTAPRVPGGPLSTCEWMTNICFKFSMLMAAVTVKIF